MPSTALYFLNEKWIPSEWNLIILFFLSLTALEYISHENLRETIIFFKQKKPNTTSKNNWMVPL